MTLWRQLPARPSLFLYSLFDSCDATGFVTGRQGGVSQAPYQSLNTDAGGGDDPAHVVENLRLIYNGLGVNQVITARQIHGDHVIFVDDLNENDPGEGDALVTASPYVAVGVRTADCVPLLITDIKGRVAAAIHAGRAGVEKGITARTVAQIEEKYGVEPGSMVAMMGPHIRSCCYQVDEESARRFSGLLGCAAGRMIDMAAALKHELAQAGLATESIHDCGLCTACRVDLFFSYRREKGVTGRLLSGIWLTGEPKLDH